MVHKEQAITVPDMDGWMEQHSKDDLDNLTSYIINLNVLRLCQENGVKFVCLLPNSTHITQPLDIAYFKTLKIKWKQVITSWKESASGKNQTAMPKDQFPALLEKTLDELQSTTSQNVISGFRKASSVPLNVKKPLSRLSNQDRQVHLNMIGDFFLQRLEDKQSKMVTLKTNSRKKMNVAAGQNICPDDIEEANNSYVSETLQQPWKIFRQVSSLLPAGASLENSDGVRRDYLKSGNYVTVMWQGKQYPGVVISISDDEAVIECMQERKKGLTQIKDEQGKGEVLWSEYFMELLEGEATSLHRETRLIRSNNEMSPEFAAKNGVKQGGTSSPSLPLKKSMAV
ncbi:hypothetical protein ILUMI_26109 [Ignelater luminosus]|uniref:Uncharacterized protein n=1 Tax=Ignelater luminosus TaxID=2038154 RepID=A0A8K0C424_IGNLU|nr:hypothetical protein ILUMI_26109 [Ignelater luminosus]